MTQELLHWQAKLAAWIHDPAEKALVLLRDPAGHEGGTTRTLRRELFPDGLPPDLQGWVKKADRWAAAADRPQFPLEANGGRYPAWTQVNFAERPILKHPLTGQDYDLNKLDLAPALLKAVSTDHFQQFIENGAVNWRKTALAFWRFGPETPAGDLGALWSLLPADTRVPDHTIWAHLDLTGALAGAFASDPAQNPALLLVSFGPVQDFIAQARSTSDLWAGSHLLSRLAWEGLKVISERLGPDSVIFPQLRGVALVDLWLQQEIGLPAAWFQEEEWRREGTDANPLFAAALPNKFMALVPAGQAETLAQAITERVRNWVRETAETMLADLLKAGRFKEADKTLPCWTQLTEQLAGFPEVYWAAVPWSPLVGEAADGTPNPAELRAAQAPFQPEGQHGFLASDACKLLSRELRLEGQTFFRPNPGVLYPALYELLEKLGAAAKAIRPFAATHQTGYRDSLGGEVEWLTTDRAQLALPPGQRPEQSLWNRVAGQFGIRAGEHLGALGMFKRLWPRTFTSEISDLLDRDFRRFVVSTHTLALATSLEQWLQRPDRPAVPLELRAKLEGQATAILPRKLARALRPEDQEAPQLLLRRLPAYLDFLRDTGNDEELGRTHGLLEKLLGAKPETYYALLLMDGDQMGAWLTGSNDAYCLPYRATWHPQILANLQQRDGGDLHRYLGEKRAVSPARHMAISGALNSFALTIARHIVEDLGKGKLLYAGGDDVMAMVSVDDLLPVLFLLRLAYSGEFARDPKAGWETLGLHSAELRLGGGHALYQNHQNHQNRLYRMMGGKATASVGAVVAHHSAPLGMVLRELRASEKRAKNAGGRNAFSLALLKRAGGITYLTSRWQLPDQDFTTLAATPMGLLIELKQALADPAFSRRAAYLVQTWLPQLPPPAEFTDPAAYAGMLGSNLAYQFQRQGGEATLGRKLATYAIQASADASSPTTATQRIHEFLTVAEFLARESRTGYQEESRHD